MAKPAIYNPPTALGKFIYDEMKALGLSVRKFAARCGLGQLAIFKLYETENAARTDLVTLMKLSRQLNVSLITLICLANPNYADEIASQLEQHTPAIQRSSIRRLQYTDPELVDAIARIDQILTFPGQKPDAVLSEQDRELRELLNMLHSCLDLLLDGYTTPAVVATVKRENARIIDFVERLSARQTQQETRPVVNR